MQKSKINNLACHYNGVFWLSLAGVFLYLLALPPTELWWLGWLVAACWTPVIRRNTFPRKAYRKIWLCGMIFWAVAVHWICYAHWATCFGWVALSCYLGMYFPLFIFFARTLHHTTIWKNFRFPVWFAAPVAWLAVMYLQKTLMGGFGFALLEHTQARQTALIQLADIGGESLVGAIMIFVGVLFGYCLPVDLPVNPETKKVGVQKPSFRQVVTSFVAILLTFLTLLCYAQVRESQRLQSDQPPLCVALLQGNFRASLSAPQGWYEEVFDQYKKLAFDAARNEKHRIDVIIWPESTCIYPWVDVDRSMLPTQSRALFTVSELPAYLIENNKEIFELSQTIGIPCIYGVGSYVFWEKEKFFQYNSALLIDNTTATNYDLHGRLLKTIPHYSRYDKMLLVMFGEYVPFVDYLPEKFFLKTLCQRANFGMKPVSFFLSTPNDNQVDNVANNYIVPVHPYSATTNICFESSSSHLIRQQVLFLKKAREEPTILINISNDGWFNHSSQIDMHLATHVFRAIESRKPYLAATNGGFSAGIDGSGNILAIGQRGMNQVVYVDLTADNRFSPYHFLGSIFHISSFGCVVVILIYSFLFGKHSENTFLN